jgi:phenylpropionate dioxygenase-like ring-hydroxylating dioxygenase large terminal subunit
VIVHGYHQMTVPPTATATVAPAAVRSIDNVEPALAAAFHPVCRSSEVRDGSVVKVTLLGVDWAVARIDGALTALVDRCPHRGAPLSAGCVIDGTLQCAYHGYRFGPTGRCELIPALGPAAAIPPKAHTRAAHSVQERYGLVWLAPDEPLEPIIDIPEWTDPAFVVVELPDQTWNAGAAQMVDNFLDLAHFPFTHLDTFGDPDDEAVPSYEVRRDGFALTCDYVHSTKPLDQSMGSVVGTGEFSVAQRRSTWWYVAPFAIRLRIDYVHEDVVLTILFFHQPVDEHTTKLYCFDLRNDIADGRTTAAETIAFQVAVAEEDRRLLERLPHKSMPLDLTAECHTRADRITVEMRRILADFLDAAVRSTTTDSATTDHTTTDRSTTDRTTTGQMTDRATTPGDATTEGTSG